MPISPICPISNFKKKFATKLAVICLASMLATPLVLMAQQTAFSTAPGPVSSRSAGSSQGVAVLASRRLEIPSPPVGFSTLPSTPEPEAVILTPVAAYPPPRPAHRFWDSENRWLFALNGALATADFFTTRANLASGGQELNPVTRVLSGSTPGLAANFAIETSGVIGISYFLHKTGHHKLERATSLLNLGGSAGAVAYGLSHR